MAQAAYSVGMSSEGTPAAALYQAFFGVKQGPVVPLLSGLHRALGAASLSDGATGTLLLLYSEYVPLSLLNGHVGQDGWVMVWPSKERLAQESGRRRSTINEHLVALEGIGALRRSAERVNGRTGVMWLRPAPELLALLEGRAEVQEILSTRFEQHDDPRVTAMTTRMFLAPLGERSNAVEVPNPVGRRVADRTPLSEMPWPEGWDDVRFARWFEYTHAETVDDMKSMYARMAALKQAQSTAESETAEAKARRDAKPKSRLSVRKKTDTTKTDTAPALLNEMRARVMQNFPNAFNLPTDVKSLSQMRQLLDRYGEDETRRLVEFVSEAKTWESIKAKWPKIELFQPTPGWLLAWSESLLQWMKSGAQAPAQPGPKRSGGAEVYTPTTTDSKGRLTF